jgi:hypothetical protein
MTITREQIEQLASRKGVRKIAVHNFLGTLGDMRAFDATQNLYQDARDYRWNAATIAAIKRGIQIGCKK